MHQHVCANAGAASSSGATASWLRGLNAPAAAMEAHGQAAGYATAALGNGQGQVPEQQPPGSTYQGGHILMPAEDSAAITKSSPGSGDTDPAVLPAAGALADVRQHQAESSAACSAAQDDAECAAAALERLHVHCVYDAIAQHFSATRLVCNHICVIRA